MEYNVVQLASYTRIHVYSYSSNCVCTFVCVCVCVTWNFEFWKITKICSNLQCDWLSLKRIVQKLTKAGAIYAVYSNDQAYQ